MMPQSAPALFTPTCRPFPEEMIPEAVFDERPEWVELYREAWRSAWRHVYESAETPVSPYMSEGCATSLLWIWDTSLMTFFCRYAFRAFPGVESLDNLYRIMAGEPCALKIQHPDNPPLPAWAEREYFRFTGDAARLRRLLAEERTLEKYYCFLESLRGGDPAPPWGAIPLSWRCTPEGYHWNGISSGMDNTPRGRGDYETLLWFDAAAQQGLAARSIAEMAAAIGDEPLRDAFLAEYRRKTELVQRYWDPECGAFFDRRGGAFSRVLTPAVFWPMAAGMATVEQAERLASLVADPEKLGGHCPCPTVSRDDPDFSPDGLYWRGAVWVPLVYMTSVALRNYGKHAQAAELTRKLLDHMYDTWRGWSPHSIWECYKPDRPEPALNSKNRLCRADFCGWSALGPISLFLEDIIGIHEVSAAESKICWRLSSAKRHGVRRLAFGENVVSLIYDGGMVEVTAARPFTLEVDSTLYACPAGTSSFLVSHGSTPPSRT